MLANGVTSADEVTSDAQLRGYDVDMRQEILQDRKRTVRIYNTYGEVQVRTRAGDCDIGWALYFQTHARRSCTADCPPLDSATASGSVSSWEP